VSPTWGPSGRADHTPERVLADTWEWDGGDWTQAQDTGPSARSGHALAYGHATAYDQARGQIVLFGGNTAAPGATTSADLRSDTWELR
jgi:hypothetical protein